MTEKSDEGRLDISFELTDRGVTGSTNLRTVSVFDRLVGAIFGRWTPDLERKPVLTEAVTEGQRRLIEAAVNAGVRDIEKRGMSAHEAARLMAQLDPKKRNVAHVALEAFEELTSSAFEAAIEDHTGPTIDHGTSADVDDDWLNFFEGYAEKATSENMRKLWGRILAGEIRKPGAFSLRTLRIASELDRETASVFQEFATRRLGKTMLSSEVAENKNILKLAKPMPRIDELDAAGLVDAAGGMGVSKKLNRTDDNPCVGQRVEGKFVEFHIKLGRDVQLQGYNLTRAGFELASFLPVNEQATIDNLVAQAKSDCDLITLREIVKLDGKERLSEARIATLFEAPKP
ncbi:DUF2806 domain-containing protein [Mesorhizobium sp. C416B]|uniref:DUF2806 domain-containing protein n=1 Tax=unclassified Mesorhizobium TaxID=325217 RepID=UPI0003FAB8C1|nr:MULTISPECIES: DUF2806 domain-containing protein [unclassified Mesorhizobium]WJI61672.1 DUF2806 domain-containing protein [Mesorhizobium sp. C416B]